MISPNEPGLDPVSVHIFLATQATTAAIALAEEAERVERAGLHERAALLREDAIAKTREAVEHRQLGARLHERVKFRRASATWFSEREMRQAP